MTNSERLNAKSAKVNAHPKVNDPKLWAFTLSFHPAKLSHAGMAYANLLKDEVEALIDEKGFKPFALATIEVHFYEDFYEEYVYYGPSALKFELIDAEFKGGMGSWDTLLKSPLHLEHERKKKEIPSSPKPF